MSENDLEKQSAEIIRQNLIDTLSSEQYISMVNMAIETEPNADVEDIFDTVEEQIKNKKLGYIQEILNKRKNA